MQPQILINFLTAYNRFLNSLPRRQDVQFYLVIKAVLYETYMFYKNAWHDASVEEVRRLQTVYQQAVWSARIRYGPLRVESSLARPRLPPPQ